MSQQPTAMPMRARPYRDFLTPSWHRKFTNAALLTYGLCFFIGSASAPSGSSWLYWLLRSTVQTLLLFIAALMVFILRVAATHVGSRTSASPLKTVTANLFNFSVIQVYFWYIFSAWLFTEVVSWSASPERHLYLINHTNYGERLNERAIYLRTSLTILAIIQATWHLYSDQDQAPMPIPNSRSAAKDAAKPQVLHPLTYLNIQAMGLLRDAAVKLILNFFLTLILYFALLRNPLWEFNFNLFSALRLLDRYTQPSTLVPAMPLFGFVFLYSTILITIWDFSSAAYNAFITQEPLKLGRPLTDSSKDPNGTLITGLKAKKDFARANAFWELGLIVKRFPERRVTFFMETDRQPTATWTQISLLCLAEVQGISSRIQALNRPAQSPPTTSADITQPQLRKNITAPLKQDNVLQQAPPPKRLMDRSLVGAGQVMKSFGNSPGTGYQPVIQAAEWGANKATKSLPPAALNAVQPENVRAQATGSLTKIIRTPWIGSLFQETFSRRATAVICGTPFAQTSILVNAIQSLSMLVVLSLKEDKFGEVQKSVANVINTYSSTLGAINSFMASLQPHWTDVQFVDGMRKQVPEVEAVKTALREGLEAMVGAFGEYAGSLGLGQAELRQAKALVGPNMKEQKLLK